MKKEILLVAEAVSNEKGVERHIIFEAIELALATVARKSYPMDVDTRVNIDTHTGDYTTFRRWLVVADDTPRDAPEDDEETLVYNPDMHFLASDAASKNPDLIVGSYHEELIENAEFGRISAQMSKQIIMQKIREAERNQVIAQYHGREGELVSGVVKKVTKDFLIVDLGNNAEGFLNRDQLVGREIYRINDRIRAVITEINAEHRGPQIILSRIVPEMISRMFELEVPEIAEQIITISKAARDPGMRAKIAVRTNDSRIDPVGACVGMRGSRVQAVTNELDGERVDIVLWDDDPAQFVINVLAPAEVESIIVDEERGSMDVAVAQDNLAQAIGRNGQNVRLATQLTGWTINIMSVEEAMDKQSEASEETVSIFTAALDIDEDIAQMLSVEGFTSLEQIAYVELSELSAIEGFDEEIAEELRSRANDALLAKALSGEMKTPAEDLLTMEGMTETLAYKLAKMDICTMEDLAEQSIDELMMLNDDEMDEDKAGKLIMTAREPWFA